MNNEFNTAYFTQGDATVVCMHRAMSGNAYKNMLLIYTKLKNKHIFNFTTATNWPLRNTFHSSLDALLVHSKTQY
jgi:hypothetical protein